MSKKQDQEYTQLQKKISTVLAAKKDLAIRLSKGRYSKGVHDHAEKERRAIRSAIRPRSLSEALGSALAKQQNEAVASRYRGEQQ